MSSTASYASYAGFVCFSPYDFLKALHTHSTAVTSKYTPRNLEPSKNKNKNMKNMKNMKNRKTHPPIHLHTAERNLWRHFPLSFQTSKKKKRESKKERKKKHGHAKMFLRANDFCGGGVKSRVFN